MSQEHDRLPLEERLAREMASNMARRGLSISPDEQLRRLTWLVSAEVMKGKIDEERVRILLEEMEAQQILIAGLAKVKPDTQNIPSEVSWASGISVFIAKCFQHTPGDPISTIGTPFFDAAHSPHTSEGSFSRIGVTTAEAIRKIYPDFEYKTGQETSFFQGLPTSLVERIHVNITHSNANLSPRDRGITAESVLFDRLESSVTQGPQLGYRSVSSLSL